MASQLKSLWLVFILIAAGVIIFFLSLTQNKSQNDQGVVLKEIFNQAPRSASAESNIEVASITPQVAAPTVTPASVTQSAPEQVAAENAVQEAKVADPVPPMAIVTSPEDGREGSFAIQVYSFQDRARAETALESLKKNGYDAFLIVSDLGEKGTWYRIRVGGIPDEAAAQKLLNEIRKSYNSGFIVKPKK